MQNIKRCLYHLRQYARMESKYFWCADEIFTGDEKTIWGLLNNLYCIFSVKTPGASPRRISPTLSPIMLDTTHQPHLRNPEGMDEVVKRKRREVNSSLGSPQYKENSQTPVKHYKNQLYSEIHSSSRLQRRRQSTDSIIRSKQRNTSRFIKKKENSSPVLTTRGNIER